MNNGVGRSTRKMVAVVLCSAAALAAGPAFAAKPVPLDGLIGFYNPYDCSPRPAFVRLIDSLIRITPDYRLLRGTPVVPAAYRASIGRISMKVVDDMHEATLPLTGTWQGLPLISLSRYMVEEGDTKGFTLTFAASRAQVLAAVNRLGFRLPKSGERETEEGMTTTISVTATGRVAHFGCSDG